MRVDIMKGLQAPFQGKNWISVLLIGSALIFFSWLLIPMVLFTGYCVSVLRDTANGGDNTLPDFNPGSQGVPGLMVFLGLLLLNLVPGGIMMFGVGSIVMAIVSAGVVDPKVWAAAMASAGVVSLSCIMIGCLLMLVVSFFTPALIMRYAVTGEFSSLFGFGQAISDIMAAPLDYLVIFLLPNLLGFVFSLLVSVTFGIASVLVPTFSAVVGIVSARLMGDYYRLCLN